MQNRKFRKVTEREWVGGVCAGLAYFVGAPVWIVRLVWAMAMVYFGVGGFLYLCLWFFLPAWESTPKDYDEVTGD